MIKISYDGELGYCDIKEEYKDEAGRFSTIIGVVNTWYTRLYKENKESALRFKDFFTEIVNDGLLFETDAKKIKKIRIEQEAELLKTIISFLKSDDDEQGKNKLDKIINDIMKKINKCNKKDE